MGITDDELKPLNNTTLAPKLSYPYYYSSMQAHFKGSCPINENSSISNEKVFNIYIVYHLDNTSHSFHPKLKNCLFGSVNITKKQ